MTTKTQTRLARQEHARSLREAQRHATRRKRNLLVGGIVAAVLVLAVAIGLAVGASQSGSGPVTGPKDAVTSSSKIATAGVAIGKASAPVTVDAYENFNCPIRGKFESAVGATVTSLVNSGAIKVRYHLMSFIDANNGGTYSHRAANAFAAADTYGGPDKALALHAALYAHQPDETAKAGLSDGQILQYAAAAGLTSPQFTSAVHDMAYRGWVSTVADDASKAGVVTGTPTFYMNGKNVPLQTLLGGNGQNFDPAAFTSQVNAAKATPAT